MVNKLKQWERFTCFRQLISLNAYIFHCVAMPSFSLSITPFWTLMHLHPESTLVPGVLVTQKPLSPFPSTIF